MLLPSLRYTRADYAAWRVAERADAAHCRTLGHRRRVEQALVDMRSFVAQPEPCYVGVSWGKDSLVVAHLAARLASEDLRVPVVWLPAIGLENPDNYEVRDAFLSMVDVEYVEVPAVDENLAVDVDGHDGFQAAFERVFRTLAKRYISGIRAEESGTRKRRGLLWGTTTPNTCAPLTWWTAADVFAYLYANGLPVHPAYACTMGGSLDRGRIRVATLGGKKGTGHGRREWEARYYGRELRTIQASGTKSPSPLERTGD